MKGASFGCGQCMACRFNRRRIWTHRLMLEAAVHPAASFVTLTYKPEELPDGGTLVPDHLSGWLKRFRARFGKVRFYGVGEYGEVFERPHYHVALYGYGPDHGRAFEACWPFGYVHAGTLTLQSAQYVAGYVTKKMTGKDDERLRGRHPEFARMSLRPGIGAPAVSSIVRALESEAGRDEISRSGDVPSVLNHGRRSLPLGRYIRERIRKEIGFEFVKENPAECFKRTAELLNLYKDYAADKEKPLGLAEWDYRRQAVKDRQFDARSKIRFGGKL